jgi:hypothetical protein
MSVAEFISRNLTQTAVYWGNPQEDGYGSKTFNDPIEISCRWENVDQVLGGDTGDDRGMKYISRALAYVDRVLDEEGYLWLGRLADLEQYLDSSSGTYIDPMTVPDAHVIKRKQEIPRLGSNTKFLYRVYLTPWLT